MTRCRGYACVQWTLLGATVVVAAVYAVMMSRGLVWTSASGTRIGVGVGLFELSHVPGYSPVGWNYVPDAGYPLWWFQAHWFYNGFVLTVPLWALLAPLAGRPRSQRPVPRVQRASAGAFVNASNAGC